MAQEVKRTITIETKKSENKLREFRKEMTRLRGELVELEEGTEEYNRTLTELSNRQQKLNDIQEDIRTSMQDLGARINNLNRVTRGAVGGFTAIQGAINLLGASDTALEPMLKQMTNLLSIIEGLEQIEGLTKSIPQLINSFKGFGQELSDWFGNLFGGIDNRIDTAADSLNQVKENIQDIDINTEIVEPFDEANKKIQEVGEGTRRINDFVEPIGSEVEKIKKSLETVSVGGKDFISVEKSLRAITTEANNLAGVGANTAQVAAKMSEAAKNLGLDLDKLLDAHKKGIPLLQVSAKTTETAATATKGYSIVAKAADLATRGWAAATTALGYAMKTVGLTVLVTAIVLAVEQLIKGVIKLYNLWNDNRAIKKFTEANEKLAEALAAVNQELYPESNKSRLSDELSKAIIRRVDLEEKLNNLVKERASLERKGVFPIAFTIKSKQLDKEIATTRDQINEINKLIKETDTALKTFSWKEKQEQPLPEKTDKVEEKRTYYGPVLTDQQREEFLKSLDEFLRSRNEVTFERNKELEDQMRKHYEELRKQQLEAEAKEREFQQKRVQGIFDSVQAIGDITYGLSQIYYAAAQKDDLSDKQREERLKKYRAFLIATAAIDTAVSTAKAVQAAIGAMADTPGPLWTRIAAWGSVLATGLAGVAQMVSAFNSVNLSTGSSVASVTPPNIQTPPVAYTRNLLTDEETDQLNKSTRVYVLESDITNAQNAVKATVTNATF